MSEVKLNLIDRERVLHGNIHGSVADRCIAALSAEPETLAELEAALARYDKLRDSESQFSSFALIEISAGSASSSAAFDSQVSDDCDLNPWDAGIVLIDLAARIVATESSYSQPGPEGAVEYHDGNAATEVSISYHLPDDWLFVNSVDAWRWSRSRRACERAARAPIDTRAILFGLPLLNFLVNAVLALPNESLQVSGSDENGDALLRQIGAIHARWLMTPRDDLRGQTPREVLLERQDFIDCDLQSRAEQWSSLDEGPPCLSPNSFAYRFAGFGTHEWVLYYDLIRELIASLFELRIQTPFADADELIARLERLKAEWLESPQAELSGRVPAIIIDNERKRLPQAMRPHDMIIDDDCPVCRMLGDETSLLGMGVGFWHLDGSHMDEDFAFSYFKTQQEWENENRQREEFYLELDRRSAEREQSLADAIDEDGLRGRRLSDDPF